MNRVPHVHLAIGLESDFWVHRRVLPEILVLGIDDVCMSTVASKRVLKRRLMIPEKPRRRRLYGDASLGPSE